MAAGEIKTTIKLDGEAKFKQAISGAKKEMSALKAEMKAQVATFKAQGDAMAAAKAEAEGLREQEKQQAEIVKALENALAEATAKYGENSTAVQNYRIQLANAQTSLANLSTSASEAESTVESMASGMESAGDDIADSAADGADALGEMADEVDTLDSKGGMDKLKAGLDVVADAASAAYKVVKELYDMVGKSSTWADDLITLSQQTGIDVTTLQQMQHASKLVDTSVETITGSMTNLRKAMTNNGGKKVSTFRDWAMSVGLDGEALSMYDSNTHQLKSTIDYFWDVIQSMYNSGIDVTTDTSAQAALGQLFGQGNVSDLMPLIKNYQSYVDAMNSTSLVSEEEVQTLGDYNDGLENLTDAMTTLQNVWSATLAPVFDAFNEGLTDTITNLTDWLRDADVSAMLESVTKTIGDVMGMISQMASGDISFQDLLDTIKGWLSADGEGSFSDMVASGVKNMIAAITSGIEGLFSTDSGDSIVGSLLESVGAFVNGLFNGVMDGFTTVMTDESIDISGTVSTYINGALDAFFGALEAMFDFSDEDSRITSLLEGIGNIVIEIVEGVFNGILTWIDGKFGTNYSGNNAPQSTGKLDLMGASIALGVDVPTIEAAAEVTDATITDGAAEAIDTAVGDLNPDFEAWLAEGSKTEIPKEVQSAINSGSYFADVTPVIREGGGSTNGTGGGRNRSVNWSAQLPSYDVGTSYVPFDQVALIHRGERVMTADENKRYSKTGGINTSLLAAQIVNGMSGVTFNIDGNAVGRMVAPSVNELLAQG